VAARRSRKRRRSGASFDTARAIALRLPGVDEGTSYGTPAFRVRGELFARLHQDGDALVVRADFDAREALLRAKPKSFFVTDHYRAYPWVLVRLAAISRADLTEALTEAWRECAPRNAKRA
jgi:hypothetical protein